MQDGSFIIVFCANVSSGLDDSFVVIVVVCSFIFIVNHGNRVNVFLFATL